MRILTTLFLILVYFISIPWHLLGNANKSQAEKLVRMGRAGEAIQFYRRYLDSGQAQGDFGDSLLRASMLEIDSRRGLNLLLLYDKKMTKTEDRKKIFHRIGLLQEYFGNDEAAVAAYQVAFENSYPPDYQIYLRVGYLSLELGEAERALSIARTVLSNSRETQMRLAAITLSLLAYASIGDLENGLSLIKQQDSFLNRTAGPSYYYALHRFYRSNGEIRKSLEMKEKVVTTYPDSPEAMILQKKAKIWNSPANLFF